MSVSTNAIKFCWLSYFVRVFVILDGNVAFLLFPLSVGDGCAKKRADASLRAAACPARERSYTRLNAQHRVHSTYTAASLSFERVYARGRRRRRRRPTPTRARSRRLGVSKVPSDSTAPNASPRSNARTS